MTPPRFYPILDDDALRARGLDPLETARELAHAGVRLAQFRHKGDWGREAYRTAERVGRVLQDAGCRYIVNDRVDIALAVGADGVHLGQDDLPPADARRIAGDRLALGLSTHNEAQLRAAASEPVDYLALGPVFATRSKRNPDPVLGVEELARLRPLARRPLVAIGGVRLDNAAAALAAGADSVAVIAAWLDDRAQLSAWTHLQP